MRADHWPPNTECDVSKLVKFSFKLFLFIYFHKVLSFVSSGPEPDLRLIFSPDLDGILVYASKYLLSGGLLICAENFLLDFSYHSHIQKKL